MSLHPDLAKMSKGTHHIFNSIVLDSVFNQLGMATFKNTLYVDEVEAIHQFLIMQQKRLYRLEQE